VVHEQTGLIVPVRNIEALVVAIRRMAEDPKWATQLGEAGRERALELYDENKVVRLQLDRIVEAARLAGL
jgi:glycosyltransferase involved in cell wall biosynthesis